MLEFLVDSINPEGLVLGRNGDREIPLGTMFTAVTRSRVHRDSRGYLTEELGEVGRVALTLREVHWYQRTIDHIPRGHTAGLAVTGDGLELLAGLLSSLPPHECLALVAADPQGAEPPRSSGQDGGRRARFGEHGRMPGTRENGAGC